MQPLLIDRSHLLPGLSLSPPDLPLDLLDLPELLLGALQGSELLLRETEKMSATKVCVPYFETKLMISLPSSWRSAGTSSR